MNYTNILLALIAVLLVVVIGAVATMELPQPVNKKVVNEKAVGGLVQNEATYTSANTDSNIEVGPDEEKRVVATTSRRSYARFETVNNNGESVWCRADADKPASVDNHINVASSSPYTIESDDGNLYVGSVRCTANASTTLHVLEYAD